MDFYTFCLFFSLVICGAGLAYRLVLWLRRDVAVPRENLRRSRLGAVLGALASRLHPVRLAALLRALVLDGLLQVNVLRQSPLRWAAHFAVFTGFVGLVVMHAMQDIVSYPHLPGYEPTLDPYQFLRNLFGVLVLAGVAAALARRLRNAKIRAASRGRDFFLLGLVAAVVASGFALEAAKILSTRVFDRMVEDYYYTEDPDELAGIRLYWAEHFGAYYPDPPADPEGELYALGEEIHELGCAPCHSPLGSAFVSYPLALGARPAGGFVQAVSASRVLWYLHVFLTFFALACLPFTKLLHMVATPLGLAARPNRLGPQDARPDPPADATMRALAMDACTRCGKCSEHCSVWPAFRVLGNPDILPSEKLVDLARMSGGDLDAIERARLVEGSFICTECYRCTEVCPVRIDLQDLWGASRRELARRLPAEPYQAMARADAAQWARRFRDDPPKGPDPKRSVNLTDDAGQYWACVQCTTCTGVCPVVAATDNPVDELDLTPQQIMNMLRMRRKDLALGARMVWNCVTCYKCQEHCPQNIRVADVLYELRNIASARLARENAYGEDDET